VYIQKFPDWIWQNVVLPYLVIVVPSRVHVSGPAATAGSIALHGIVTKYIFSLSYIRDVFFPSLKQTKQIVLYKIASCTSHARTYKSFGKWIGDCRSGLRLLTSVKNVVIFSNEWLLRKQFFCDVVPCGWVADYCSFEETYRFHLLVMSVMSQFADSQTWRSRRHVPSKRRKLTTPPHGSKTQNSCFFITKRDLQLKEVLQRCIISSG